jgi:hypothetical protein
MSPQLVIPKRNLSSRTACCHPEPKARDPVLATATPFQRRKRLDKSHKYGKLSIMYKT